MTLTLLSHMPDTNATPETPSIATIAANIGRSATTIIGSLTIPVIVRDAAVKWGNVQYRVEALPPVTGLPFWVREKSLTFTD